MATFVPADVAASMQEQLAAQHARWSDLTNKTLDHMMKLVDATLKATKDSMEESSALMQQFITANSPQELMSLGTEESRLNLERFMSYGGDVAHITSTMQNEISRAAQAEFTDCCQRIALLVESFSQHLPDDSKSPYLMMKFALEKANSGYEQWAAMTQQVAEAVDSNLSMATGQFPSSRKTGSRTKKISGRE